MPAPSGLACGQPAGPAIATPRARMVTARSPLPEVSGRTPLPASVPSLPSSRLQPFPPPRSVGLPPSPPAATDPYLHPANVLTPPGQASGSQSGSTGANSLFCEGGLQASGASAFAQHFAGRQAEGPGRKACSLFGQPWWARACADCRGSNPLIASCIGFHGLTVDALRSGGQPWILSVSPRLGHAHVGSSCSAQSVGMALREPSGLPSSTCSGRKLGPAFAHFACCAASWRFFCSPLPDAVAMDFFCNAAPLPAASLVQHWQRLLEWQFSPVSLSPSLGWARPLSCGTWGLSFVEVFDGLRWPLPVFCQVYLCDVCTLSGPCVAYVWLIGWHWRLVYLCHGNVVGVPIAWHCEALPYDAARCSGRLLSPAPQLEDVVGGAHVPGLLGPVVVRLSAGRDATVQSCWVCIDAFVRSFLALHFLVLCRLLFFAVPLRQGCPQRNWMLRRSRRFLRGAPLLLLLAWLFPLASAMQPQSQQVSRCNEGLPDNPANWPVPAELPAADVPAVVVSDEPLLASFAEDCHPSRHVPDPGEAAPSVSDMAAERQWMMPVVGLRYQQPHLWTSVRGDIADEDMLFEAAEAHFCSDTPECHVVVAHPQPHALAPTFLVVASSASFADRVPFCLQVYKWGSQPGISMEYLEEMSFLPDFIALLPEEAKPGVQIFAGDRSDPLTDSDTVHLCPGLLIRAFPSSIPNPRRALTLQVRLQRAWNEFADLDVDGSVEPDYSHFVVGILEPAELPRAFPMLEGGLEEIALGVSRFLHRPRDRFRLLEPLIDAPALAVLGVPVSRTFGVVPIDCAQWIPVFVDPREFAQHLRVVLLPPVPLTIFDFLRYSHLRIPTGYKPLLLGLGARQTCPPRMQFRPREVITVQAVVDEKDSDPAPDFFPADSDLDGDMDPSRGRVRPYAWLHGARGSTMVVAGSSSAPAGASTCGGSFVRRPCLGLCAEHMWNWGLHDSLALPSRPPEDTSVASPAASALHPQRLVIHELLRNLVWRQDCLLQACISRQATVPMVYNSSDAGHVPLEHAAPVTQERPPDLATESSSSADAWLVAVCVLRYQHAPRFCTLWVLDNEDIEAFSMRAVSLLSRAGIAEDIVLVDPSPFPDTVTFVAMPRCWRSLGRTLCVVAWPPAAAPPFAEVADCDTTLDDFLRELPPQYGTALDVYVDGPVVPTSVSEQFQPPSGTLLSICPEGEMPSVLCRVADLLADSERATADDALPGARDTTDVWLLLCPSMEPTAMCRNDLPASRQLALVCDIAEAELLVWHCSSDFSRGAIHGCECSHYVAVRRGAVGGQASLSKVVFLDPRAVGQPFDSICFPPSKTHVSLGELGRCLALPVVEGYQLHVWRNDDAAEARMPMIVQSCDAWTFRLLPCFPSAGIQSAHTDEAECAATDRSSGSSTGLTVWRLSLAQSAYWSSCCWWFGFFD